MSEVDFLRDLDGTLHAAFALAGMGSQGRYTAKDGSATEGVRAYVERNIETIGELRQFRAGRVEIVYLRSDVAPDQGDRFELASSAFGTEVFVNSKKLSDDGSQSRWLVTRG